MKSNKTVILVYPRLIEGDRRDKAPPPLSLLSLSGSLKKLGKEVKLYDLRCYDDYEALLRALPESPVCFGLSAMVSNQIRDGVAFSEAAHKIFPSVPIVWGGWFPTTLPDIAISHSAVDILVRGQGEVTFTELVRTLATGGDLAAVKGIVYKEKGQVLKNPMRNPVDLNDLPPIDYTLLDMPRSTIGDGMANYVSSAGCPYNCKFCDVQLVFGKKWMALHAGRVLDDIERLVKEYGVHTVDFYDDNFFVNRQRLREIMQGLISRNLSIRWIANGRVDQFIRLEEEDIALIRKAGCQTLTFGAESGNQKTLDFLQKGTRIEQIEETARRLRNHDILIRYNFLVGVPGETPADFQKTLQFILKIKSIHPGLSIVFYYYMPVPETQLTEEDIKMGFKEPDTFEGWSKCIIGDVTQPWSFHVDESIMVDRRDTFKVMSYYFWRGYLLPDPEDGSFFWGARWRIVKMLGRLRVRTGFYACPVEWNRFRRRR